MENQLKNANFTGENMTKKRINEILINCFVASYKLLIFCLNATSKENTSILENEKCLQIKNSTSILIKNIENTIINCKIYNDEFLTLKTELNDCVKNYYNVSLDADMSYISLQNKYNSIINEFYSIPNKYLIKN